jgi:dCTP deaminase
MSILSDHTIKKLCLPPTHKVGDFITNRNKPELAWVGITHSKETLADYQKRYMAVELNAEDQPEVSEFEPMIEPFIPEQCRIQDYKKIVSYGLSSYGYDVRLGREFKIFTNARNGLIDPLNPDPDCFVDHVGDYCIIPPNSYILGYTMETFNIPRDVMVVCVGKSTYARLAAIVNVTPIEPGFKGTVVIEIANCSTLPLKVYAGQGIAQFMFFQGDRPCDVSYADKDGKYQNQKGLTTARL